MNELQIKHLSRLFKRGQDTLTICNLESNKSLIYVNVTQCYPLFNVSGNSYFCVFNSLESLTTPQREEVLFYYITLLFGSSWQLI
jgi:hypothetical protein